MADHISKKKERVLVLTDHTNHSGENSLYPLLKKMKKHPLCSGVDVATRGIPKNASFFNLKGPEGLWASEVGNDFSFSESGFYLKKELKKINTDNYGLIWLRMPPPLDKAFLDYLKKIFLRQFIFNAPDGIYKTGSKEFLINFSELCPPMKLCHNIEDIIDFKNQFPIVLKPFREYGGKGIVKIDGHKVWEGKTEIDFDDFIKKINKNKIAYLGVKYLKNVSEGDKRIVVVNGKIMGASLRLPPKNSWICNVAMGGSAVMAEVDENEKYIVEKINPILSKMGIVMYGVDTLMGDDGKRVLSEINTTSIGGLPQMAKQMGLPLVEEAINLIWQYFEKNKNNATNGKTQHRHY